MKERVQKWIARSGFCSRRSAEELLRQGRANFITPANYSRDSRTFRIVTTIIDKIKVENELKLLSRYK